MKKEPKTYYGKLPPEAKKSFWTSIVCLIVLLFMLIPLNALGVIKYNWQANLYLIFLAIVAIVCIKDIEKKRKEALDRENFEMIAKAVSQNRKDIFYGDTCPYCGEALPDGAAFCSHCGKKIGGNHVLH